VGHATGQPANAVGRAGSTSRAGRQLNRQAGRQAGTSVSFLSLKPVAGLLAFLVWVGESFYSFFPSSSAHAMSPPPAASGFVLFVCLLVVAANPSFAATCRWYNARCIDLHSFGSSDLFASSDLLHRKSCSISREFCSSVAAARGLQAGCCCFLTIDIPHHSLPLAFFFLILLFRLLHLRYLIFLQLFFCRWFSRLIQVI